MQEILVWGNVTVSLDLYLWCMCLTGLLPSRPTTIVLLWASMLTTYLGNIRRCTRKKWVSLLCAVFYKKEAREEWVLIFLDWCFTFGVLEQWCSRSLESLLHTDRSKRGLCKQHLRSWELADVGWVNIFLSSNLVKICVSWQKFSLKGANTCNSQCVDYYYFDETWCRITASRTSLGAQLFSFSFLLRMSWYK